MLIRSESYHFNEKVNQMQGSIEEIRKSVGMKRKIMAVLAKPANSSIFPTIISNTTDNEILPDMTYSIKDGVKIVRSGFFETMNFLKSIFLELKQAIDTEYKNISALSDAATATKKEYDRILKNIEAEKRSDIKLSKSLAEQYAERLNVTKSQCQDWTYSSNILNKYKLEIEKELRALDKIISVIPDNISKSMKTREMIEILSRLELKDLIEKGECQMKRIEIAETKVSAAMDSGTIPSKSEVINYEERKRYNDTRKELHPNLLTLQNKLVRLLSGTMELQTMIKQEFSVPKHLTTPLTTPFSHNSLVHNR